MTSSPRRISFAELEHRTDFALLGPGFCGAAFTLVSNLKLASDADACLWVCGYEEQTPTCLSGDIEAVELGPIPAAPPIECELDHHQAVRSIEEIRSNIAAGDVYQVNYTLRARLRVASASHLAARLCRRQVPRFFAWVKTAWWPETVSASPELLMHIQNESIFTEPMKGTAATAQQLLQSKKDQAELAMIADLLRDDLHQLCQPHSVRVSNARLLISLPYAAQTVSQIEGRLRAGVGVRQALAVMHPGGSITGAPRQAARRIIAAIETSKRGLYCGALGLHHRGTFRCALLIRTAQRVDAQTFNYGVGSGITWDSNADEELQEIRLKLGAVL
jgi:para-aminobenzoate synthetase / 4-amino-4-deoxychorismate lyase